MSRHQFKKYQFVKVADVLPDSKAHFETGITGIIENINYPSPGSGYPISYSIFHVEGDEIVSGIAWFDEDQLSLTEYQDPLKALQLEDDYIYRHSPGR